MSDPKPRAKIIHRAKHIASNGDVSALCFKRPRPIDLKRATWTIVDGQVTCEACKAAMAASTSGGAS